MDDKKVTYGLDGNTSYGLNDNTGYGLDDNAAKFTHSNEQFQVSPEEQKEYEQVRNDSDNVAYDTMKDDAYRDRVESNLAAVSIGENKVPNPEYDREYTPERAESLLNSLNPKKEEKINSSRSWYNLPVYEDLSKQKTVISTKDKSSINIDKLKQVAKYIAIAAVSGAITITAIAGGISVIKEPEGRKIEKTPSTIELEEKMNNAENFNEVIDIINDHKEFNQNVYHGSDSYEESESKGGRSH